MKLKVDRIADHSFVGSWLTPASVIVDLGMNKGQFSYGVQRRYGCRVVGVEPNPALASAIAQSDRISCSNLAITPQAGPIKFFLNLDNSEGSTLYESAKAGASKQVIVEGLPFAEYLHRQHLQHVDLLKIDIEGAELDLLDQTPDEVWRKVDQISIEFHAFLTPHDLPRVKALIASMETREFFVLDFARDLSNVLMINERRHPLTLAQRATLYAARNVAGMMRMVNRSLGTVAETANA